MKIPTYTVDLLTQLKKQYPDKLEEDPLLVGTPEYWQRVGIVELIRSLEAASDGLVLKDKKA